MFRQLWPNRKWLVFLSFILFNAYLINTALVNHVRVVEGEVYDSREEVALYIFNYEELPRNFITKDAADAAFLIRTEAMDYGLNIGGDVFRYEGAIIERTDTITLRECDLYTDRDALIKTGLRGTERLVYTVNADRMEVFYTSDHYATFSRVTIWKIQAKSNITWILLGIENAVMVVYFVRYARRQDFLELTIDEPTKNVVSSVLVVIAFPIVAVVDVVEWIATTWRRKRQMIQRTSR